MRCSAWCSSRSEHPNRADSYWRVCDDGVELQLSVSGIRLLSGKSAVMRLAEFANRPYADRQLVLFAEDHLVAELDRRELTTRRPGFFDGFRLGRSGSNLGADSDQMLDAFWKAQFAGLRVHLLPKTWLPSLQLPIGHPRTATLYAAHPAAPTRYVPVSDFHRLVFEHKVAELLAILASLGAVSIKVECLEGWGQEMAARLGLGLSLAQSASVQVGKAVHGSQSLLYEATFSGDGAAQLPADLNWFRHESLWQQVAESRLRHGLTTFSLNVDYREDFGITVGLKAAAERAGLDIGGTFVRHQVTAWRLSGSFRLSQ